MEPKKKLALTIDVNPGYATDGMDAKEIPADFPGTLDLMVEKDEDGEIGDGPYLHPEYRKYKNNNNEEFEYFMMRLMERINPKQNKFNARCDTDLIREIYTVSDEAYGLLILFAQKEVWDKQKVDKKNGIQGSALKKRKNNLLNDGYGWNWDEINLYGALMAEITTRRQESVALEKHLMKVWKDDKTPQPKTTSKKKVKRKIKRHSIVTAGMQDWVDNED